MLDQYFEVTSALYTSFTRLSVAADKVLFAIAFVTYIQRLLKTKRLTFFVLNLRCRLPCKHSSNFRLQAILIMLAADLLSVDRPGA